MLEPLNHSEFDSLVERYFAHDLNDTEAHELSEYIAKCPDLGRRFISHSVVHIGLFGGGRKGVFTSKDQKNTPHTPCLAPASEPTSSSLWRRPGLWLVIAICLGVAMTLPLG